MFHKKIVCAFLILFFLEGVTTSPQLSPNIYAEEGKRAVTYSDGSKYVGEFRDGKCNGQGTFAWPDGKKYVGEFRDGKCNGQGTMTSPSGRKYVGEFRDGKCNGQGTETSPDGTKYVGEFRDNKYNGQGRLTFPNGFKYVGEFRDGKCNGQGTETWPDGTKYVGEFKDNEYNGQGTDTWPDATKYVGEFKDSEYNGQGTMTSPSGRKYVGEFKNGRFNGQGTFAWPDGKKYVGEFKDYKFNGQGTETYPDGRKYVGEFKDHKYNGQGTFTLPDGKKYVGKFKDNKYNGQGTFAWPDGKKYVGEFRDGNSMSGEYTLPNGTKYKGKLLMAGYIFDVLKDSQAERIGLRRGDIVVEYNNNPITNWTEDSHNLISATNPKDKIKIKVLRDGEEKSLTLNGGKIGIHAFSYPIIPASVIKAIDIATSYGHNVLLKNKMRVSSQRWAIIIGVSNYKDTRIPTLRYASQDAKSFYEWVISPDGGKYSPSMVKLLLDKDATGKNIKNALFIWLKQAIQEDVVMIYFAGHGSPESPNSPNNLFLLPYDALYDEIATSGFPMWDIETALKRFIKAKKVVVIADACHSGGVGQPFDVARRSSRAINVNPISSGFQNLSQIGDGVCVISASDDKQFSQESKNWGGGHGVFTYFLLEGLHGKADYNKDTNVTLGELIPYLSEQVRRSTRNNQSPTVAGKFDPALSIGR